MNVARAQFAVVLTEVWLLFAAPWVAAQAGQDLGMLEVSVRVDGLSCPFCAYGLEKKLKKVENVAKLELRVSEGRAVITPVARTSVDLAALETAVREGGFTPRALTVTARGRVTRLHGAPALELAEGSMLLLAEGGETNALLQSAKGSVVRVEGEATREQSKGHAGHPYTLTVRSFETVS